MDSKPALEEDEVAAFRARLQESLTASLQKETPPAEAAQALVDAAQAARGLKEQTATTEYEFSIRNEIPALETVMRSTLLAMVDQARKEGESLISWQRGRIRRLLEIVADLTFGSLPGKCPLESPALVFALLEDVVDMATLQECEQVFPFAESIGKFLTKTRLPQDQKTINSQLLGLLRMLNKLLKRLSKTRDSVLSGRILMFVASVWPLSERGAANILGAFNSNIEVAYSQGTDLNSEGSEVDTAFYQTFWSLQEYFRKSALLTASPSLAKFLDGVQVVLTRFAEKPVERDAGKGQAGNSEEGDAVYNTSYLTSPKLLNLQLQDPNFRRHFLLQVLYVLQWLQADRRNAKTAVGKPGKSPADLTAEVLERLTTVEAQSKQLLRAMPPHGSQFAALVDHVLEREKNWILWKYPGSTNPSRPASASTSAHLNCPQIERKALEGEAVLKAPGKRKAVRRMPLGNEVLGRVWNSTRGDPMEALRGAKRSYVPDYLEYMRRVADEMDPENGIEEEYKVANSQIYEWRGLRLSMRHHAGVFGLIAKTGGDLTALLPEELRPKLSASEQAKVDAADENSQGGGEDAEDDEGGEEKSEMTSNGAKDATEKQTDEKLEVERGTEEGATEKSAKEQGTVEKEEGDKMEVEPGEGVDMGVSKETELEEVGSDGDRKMQEEQGTPKAHDERTSVKQAAPEVEEAKVEQVEVQQVSSGTATADEKREGEQVSREKIEDARKLSDDEPGKEEAGTADKLDLDISEQKTLLNNEGLPGDQADAMDVEVALGTEGQELIPETASRGDAPEVASEVVENVLGPVQDATVEGGTATDEEQKVGAEKRDEGEPLKGGSSGPVEAEPAKPESEDTKGEESKDEPAAAQAQEREKADEGVKLTDEQVQGRDEKEEKALAEEEGKEQPEPERILDLNASPPADADSPAAAPKESNEKDSSPEVEFVSEGGLASHESQEKRGGRGRGRGRGKRKSEGEPAKRVTRRKR